MKPFFILFLTIIVSSNSVKAQSKMNIDSLLLVYKNQKLDTTKVKTLNNIINHYMYRNRKKAKKFAFEGLRLSKELNFLSGIATSNYQLGVIYNNTDNIDSAKYYYNKSLTLAKQLEKPNYISKNYRGLAIVEFSQGNLNKADSINNLDLAHTIKTNDSIGMALSYDFKGTINQNKGHFEIALKNVHKGLKLFRILKKDIRIADCLSHLATIERKLGHIKKAIEYNSEALKIYEDTQDTYYQAQVLNNIGISYLNLNELEKARSYFENSIKKSKEVNVKSIETASLLNIGTTYIKSNKPDKAIYYLNKSIELSKTINSKQKIAIAKNKLAKLYNIINKPNKALKELEQPINYATKNNNISILKNSLKHRSNAFEKLNNNKLAIADLKEFQRLSDTIANTEKLKRIEELKVIYETERKENSLALQKEEIKNLNIKAKNDKLSKALYGGGAIAGLVLSGLLYFGFHQRMKKNKIEREKQEEIFKQKIAFKQRELTSQTLHLVQKTTFLKELKDSLEKLKNSPEKFKAEFRRIVMLLKKESAGDKDWEVFKSYFSEVHDNFDNKLKAINKDISEKDLRLASFIKMNLSTKEIATILNVLPQSVLTSKYRLKKKLGIDKETDLFDFLKNIS